MKYHEWGFAAAICVLSTSVGQAADFNRPNFKALKVGKTTIAEAIALLGEPFNRGPGDDPTTTILIYSYLLAPEAQKSGGKRLMVVLNFDNAGVLKDQRYYLGGE